MDHLHPDDRQRVLDERQQLHDGWLEQLYVEYRFLPPSQRQKWIQHIGRVATRDCRRPRGQVVRRPARRDGAQAR